MAAKWLNQRPPFSIGFEPVHPSTLCENLVKICQAILKLECTQTLKKEKKTRTYQYQTARSVIVSNTVEPRLSEPRGRHTIGSDKREVRIDGVASEMTIGRV